MDKTLLMDYINYLISEQTSVKMNQLILISAGKRTPSNLFLAEKNRLQALFNAEYDVHLDEWESILHKLVEKKYLQETEGLYTGTTQGEYRREKFLEENTIFTEVSSLEFSQTRKVFWGWFVFVSQVLSEIAFENSRYIPYSSNKEEQLRVKYWLKNQGKSVRELRKLWAEEFTAYMHDLPEVYRYLLIDQLVGFNKEGLTNRQLSEKYDLSAVELSIVMNHLMHLMISTHYNSDSLIGSLIKEVHQANNNGLSQSAAVTLGLINKKWTIKAISAKRKIKLNTVKEHVLEIVLVTQKLQSSFFIPEDVYRDLNGLFELNPSLSYKEARLALQECEFFWYRLIEIERMRSSK